MLGLGSYAKVKSTQLIVQVISSPYQEKDNIYVDVRLIFDPIITFTSNITELELIEELEYLEK
jgi:hypothetical protein